MSRSWRVLEKSIKTHLVASLLPSVYTLSDMLQSVCRVCYYSRVIETEATVPASAISRKELAPNVWLWQDEKDGQFVEIVLPPFELNDLIEQCVQTFPEYVVRLCDTLAQREPTAITPETKFSPDLKKGILNTQILGTVLVRHRIREEQATPILPELKQAFGLAMQGRLRLTAHPLPEV